MNLHNFTNRLIHETSPYLLQHAHNPVDWFPWGKEAFEKAKNEHKLVLISIGYSACHWCHVMERESFEDTAVADIMNKHYVCIKVDREEHPEVDQLYMDAVHVISGRGGWPLNCFALPDGKPVYGGTYFPKHDWLQLLLNLENLYRNEPEKVKELCEEIEKGILSISLLLELKGRGESQYNFKLAEEFTAKITPLFDHAFGGYNYAPKFPMPNNYEYLLYYAYALRNMNRAEESSPIENHVFLTLDKMAMGGIYDQVGGGFARYSTDSRWKVPHFEKMLYDNAQLMSLYSNAYKYSPDSERGELYKDVIYGIHKFISAQMTSKEGGFFCAMDADSEGIEGEYYVWRKEELEELMGNDFNLFAVYYSINEDEIWEENKYILQRKAKDDVFCKENNISVADFNSIKSKWIDLLNERRQTRIAPGLDDKILTPWNGLMLKGYVDAYKAFKEPAFLDTSLMNAMFIKNKLFSDDGGLWHNYKNGKDAIPAFLDSYAFVASAFIALYEVTFDEEWLKLAKQLADYAVQYHFDLSKNMFSYISNEQEAIIVRKMEVTDNVIPASNSEMAIVLFKLGHYFGNDEYASISQNMLSVVSGTMMSYAPGYTNWGILLIHNVLRYYEVAVTGKLASTFNERLCKEYLPNMALMGAVNNSELDLLKEKFDSERTLIYICEKRTCLAPLSSSGEAINAIKNVK